MNHPRDTNNRGIGGIEGTLTDQGVLGIGHLEWLGHP